MKRINQKGFTLMEMLIVVAIIAILVAIAIPTMTAAIERTREAADASNIRAAYSDIMNKAVLGEATSVTNAGAYTVETFKADGTTKATSDADASVYKATITLTQKQAGWQSNITNIAGEKVNVKSSDDYGKGTIDKVADGFTKVIVTYTATSSSVKFELAA